MLIKREKWRKEKVKYHNETDVIKKNERNTKEQEFNYCGLLDQFATSDKEKQKTGTNFILCCIHRVIL